MKPSCLVALLLGAATVTAAAKDETSNPRGSFKDYDTNKDGYLSLDEFKARGMDDLNFRAADINGDERVEPDEFDKYVVKKKTDPKSQPKDAPAPPPARSY